MTSILMDSIINDTVGIFRQRGSDPLAVSALLNDTGQTAMINSSHIPQRMLTPSILDGLGTLMQEVEMGRAERLFWILLFSLMVLVAAGGNIIVIHIVSTNKEMKSVTNYFLVNLSLADTMVSTLNVIFNFISMLNSHWPFGSIYCKISNFIAILSISASVFTLTAISCDRYNAILHPLRPRMSHRHALGWILLIWTMSSLLAMPNMIYSVVVEDRLVNENLALTCTMIWPDGRYPLSSHDHIYNIIILVVTYLVPILTMAILYYKVGKELWGHQGIGENVEKQARAMLAKKKIVKMMIVVVIIFALCWLPYHAFFVVNYYLPTIFQDGPLLYQRCYLIMYWLAMSNSMYNPIIIYFMNSNFRHEFKRVLCFICCCRIYTPPAKNNETIVPRPPEPFSLANLARYRVFRRQSNGRLSAEPAGQTGASTLPCPIEVIITRPSKCDGQIPRASDAYENQETERALGNAGVDKASAEHSDQQAEHEPFLGSGEGSARAARGHHLEGVDSVTNLIHDSASTNSDSNLSNVSNCTVVKVWI